MVRQTFHLRNTIKKLQLDKVAWKPQYNKRFEATWL